MLIGSVAVELAAHAACPVVVVRVPEPDIVSPLPDPVVVGIDGSPTSEAAVAVAFEAASLHGAPVVAVHVWRDLLVDPPMAPLLDWDAVESDEREVLAERLAGWAAKYPDVPVRRLVVRDRPAHTLVEGSPAERSWWSSGHGAVAGSPACCWDGEPGSAPPRALPGRRGAPDRRGRAAGWAVSDRRHRSCWCSPRSGQPARPCVQDAP